MASHKRLVQAAAFSLGVAVAYLAGTSKGPSSRQKLPAPERPVAEALAAPVRVADTSQSVEPLEVFRPVVMPQSEVAKSLAAQAPRVLTTEEIVSRCNCAVAIVSGQSGSGTGFLVRPCLLATNAHVLSLERIDDIRVTFPSGPTEPVKAELVLEDPIRDLALLAVPTDLPPLEIESDYRSGVARK